MRVSGKEMFVQALDDDMYKAINEMADKLDRQVRKYKTKLESKKTQGAGRDRDEELMQKMLLQQFNVIRGSVADRTIITIKRLLDYWLLIFHNTIQVSYKPQVLIDISK